MLDQEARNRLRRALAEGEVEWVRRATRDGSRGYFRRIPYTNKEPSVAQAEIRLRFSELAYDLFGECGTVQTFDGREISRTASLMGRDLKGRKFSSEKKLSNIERILLLLR